MEKKIKTLLFDIDGTLLDFRAAEEDGLKQVLAVYGTERLDEMMMAYKRINRKLWDLYELGEITKNQITDTRFQSLFSEFDINGDGRETENRYRSALNESAILVDGAVQIMKYLYGRYDLYVVTNGFTETQTRRMADSGLDAYFIESYISEEVGYQKPQKEYFDYCLSRIVPRDKDEIMIIGDSMQSDIKGGSMAGILTCWYNPEGITDDSGIVADREIRKLTDLRSFL